MIPRPRANAPSGISARALFDSLVAEPWGQISPSVYETARLVTLAPWLSGHNRRLKHLLGSQHTLGTWGGPDGYALVPTLSATEALLTTLRRQARAPTGPVTDLVTAADAGLRTLFGWLRDGRSPSIPDTPAIEFITPSLIGLINEHLDAIADESLPWLRAWRVAGHLRPPPGMDDSTLRVIRARLAAGDGVSDKLLHSLEVAADAARAAECVTPVPFGTVGASPAATAAWIGNSARAAAEHLASRYLEAVVDRYSGLVPSVIPVTVFERAWVLSILDVVGLAADAPNELLTSIQADLTEVGTPGGAGLPPDADTTAVVLHVLALRGDTHWLDALRGYETDTHFVTWGGERTASTSTNAHVLDAFLTTQEVGPQRDWPAGSTRKIVGWLCDQQQLDGTWIDKWHASPLYATACAVMALNRVDHPDAASAVTRARKWVLEAQRDDGSWGRWEGSAEETAYAMLILLTGTDPSGMAAQSAARGLGYLESRSDRDKMPPLWHDKDLYLPAAVVRATILAAMRVAQTSPAVIAATHSCEGRTTRV